MTGYLDRVLDLWSLDRDELDTAELFWRRQPDGSWKFLVMCSDTFAPACADAEEIEEADLDALEQAVADVRALAIDEESWAPILWIARKRKLVPWRLDHRNMPDALRDLFRSVQQ